MFVRVKTTPNSPRSSVQIVASLRKGDKVSQKIVRHVGIAVDDQELGKLKELAEQIIEKMKEDKQPSLPLYAPESLQRRSTRSSDERLNVDLKDLREEQRVIEGVHEAAGALYDELGFDRVLGKASRDKGASQILKDVVLARFAQPVSKRRTALLLESYFGLKIPLDRIYRMMDKVAPKVDSIKEHVAKETMGIFKQDVDVLLYDVTTLAFESQQSDELRNFGYSKDKKFNEVQVVLALATTKEGLPVWYEVFEGNSAETATLIPSLQALSKRFAVKDIICVADRAMLSKSNVQELEKLGFRYVLGKRLRTMSSKFKSEILALKDGKDLSQPFTYELSVSASERLVVTYCPQRAKKDAKDRARALAKLQKKTKSGKTDTVSLVNNKVAKQFMSEEQKGTVVIDQSKIDENARWDGIYGVCTNDLKLTHQDILSHYKSLWHIEAAFRLSKHDLKMRPIYHWSSERIKAHCAICFLTFALARQMEYRVSIQQEPMSFAAIQEALIGVQASVVRHVSTKQLYRIPSKLSADAKKVYQAMGISRSVVPSAIQ